MILYLAGLASTQRMINYVIELNKHISEKDDKIGVMCTFANQKLVDKTIENGFENIFLDSGAFSVFNSGATIDIDNLIDFIKEREKHFTAYISLDVIQDKVGFESMANWDYMKEKGINPLPVYHAGENWEVFNHYVDNSDYVCLGGIAGVSGNWRTWIPFLDKVFYEKGDHKYHILGANDPRLIQRYPFYSCDALTWRSGSRFGQIITPVGRWWISDRNSRSASEEMVQMADLPSWLAKYDIPYPLPDDYDFNKLDESNIRIIYDLTVNYHKEHFEKLPYRGSLF